MNFKLTLTESLDGYPAQKLDNELELTFLASDSTKNIAIFEFSKETNPISMPLSLIELVAYIPTISEA